MPVKIAVVGAGAPGLSSALRILQSFPSVEVTVIADKFENETTSWGAAGIVAPFVELGKTAMSQNKTERVRQWINDSFRRYLPIADGPESFASGIILTSGYDFLTSDEPEDIERTPYVRNFRKLGPEELAKYSSDYKSGFFYTTVMVECKYYLPWLKKQVKMLGGLVIRRRIQDFSELASTYDLVVNCAGLGNQQLLNDQKLRPMRGQVLRMKAPWIKHFLYDRSRGYYLFSGRDNVVVGGTTQLDDYNTQVDPLDRERILREVGKLVPSLQYASTELEWVGLRPVRPAVRLERETVRFGNKKLEMVHNYGHGANGIALSWGTACEAAKLVGEALNQSKL